MYGCSWRTYEVFNFRKILGFLPISLIFAAAQAFQARPGDKGPDMGTPSIQQELNGNIRTQAGIFLLYSYYILGVPYLGVSILVPFGGQTSHCSKPLKRVIPKRPCNCMVYMGLKGVPVFLLWVYVCTIMIYTWSLRVCRSSYEPWTEVLIRGAYRNYRGSSSCEEF